MRTSVGWVGWGAEVTNPTQTALGSSSHRGFASHVLLAASTLTHQPAAACASDGAGRLRSSPRGVDAGAGPRPSACLSVGRSVPCLAGRACAWRCPSLVGVGGARSDGRPFVSARASAPTDDSLRGLGAALRPRHRQPSHMFGPHPNRPRAVGFAPQTASHAGILTDPKMLQT